MDNKFKFDSDATGNTGSGASETVNGKPGTGSGETENSDGNNGAKDGNGGATEQVNGTEAAPLGFTAAGTVRKRRPGGGRKPGSTNNPDATTGTTDKGRKNRLDLKNDRDKVRQNIFGLHAMAAVLTKQPLLNLNPKEADMLTTSLCDVADYHNINLMETGGAFGLYASLATCCYMIYVPRIVAIKTMRAGISSEEPIKPGEARERATSGAGRMDFGSDIQQ